MCGKYHYVKKVYKICWSNLEHLPGFKALGGDDPRIKPVDLRANDRPQNKGRGHLNKQACRMQAQTLPNDTPPIVAQYDNRVMSESDIPTPLRLWGVFFSI